MSDDLFLAQYHKVGANFVAKHDLHFTGKNAGENRIKKLQEAGLWDKLMSHIKTHDELKMAWVYEFGSKSDIDFMEAMGEY